MAGQTARLVVELSFPGNSNAETLLEEVRGGVAGTIARIKTVHRSGLTYRFVDDEVPNILSWPSDLTDEALAAVNRLHDVTHMPGGIYDPERNPGGCDKVFCMHILLEIPPVTEPAIRADERRRVIEELARDHGKK
jgi:hypothetical protein